MTCTEKPKNLTRPPEPVKPCDKCPKCGSEEITTGSKHDWAGDLVVAWTYCGDCGFLIDVG